MDDKIGLGDKAIAGGASGVHQAERIEGPFMAAYAELHPNPLGGYPGWTAFMAHNAVQSTGKVQALNRVLVASNFGTNMNTWYFGLHNNAGTDTTFTGPNAITASEISGYTTAANTSTWRHFVSFNTGMAQQTTTVGLTYVFHAAGQQTVSGPFMVGGTTNSTAGQATGNGGTAGAILYAVGSFGTAKTVNSNDSLYVTVTLSVA